MSRWRWMLGAAFVTVVAVATWSQPQESSTSPAKVAMGGGIAASGPAGSGPQIAVPWRPGRPQLGIHVYWEDNPLDDDRAVRRKARRLLDQIVAMEANSVAVSFPFFADSITASIVRTDARTPSPARMAIFLDEARQSGLRTTLRPLLDQFNLGNVDPLAWRGQLDPADRSLWFASYTLFLVPYLQMAQAATVNTVILGAELSTMQTDPGWRGLVETARRHYSGELSYSANWDAYPSAVAGVPVDVMSIDAYPYLHLNPWATEPELAGAWRAWLDATAAGDPGRLVLSEVGGIAERELVYNPAAYQTPDAPLDEDMQRRWFAAACQAGRDRQVAGFYWWKLDFHVDPALADPDRDLHDSFLGRPAERTARDCFESWGAAF